MDFHIITVFPHAFDEYLKEGTLGRAIKKRAISIQFHGLRDFADNPHRKVDDRPFGGGPGMVLQVEPVFKALKSIPQNPTKRRRVILLAARGKKFTQKKAHEFCQYNELIFVCGRYEGVDERIAKNLVDEEISIGDYILSGGELPAMVVIEAISRLIPGVLGNEASIEESRGAGGYPAYTRPEVFEVSEGEKWKVPQVLLSGNHKDIEEWRKRHSKKSKAYLD